MGDGDEETEICNLRIIFKKELKVRGFFQLILTDSSGHNSLKMMLSCKSSDRLPYIIQDHNSV